MLKCGDGQWENVVLIPANRYVWQSSDSACCLLHAGFLLGLLFSPEGVGNVPLKC
jgi:hypothetical protein